MKLFLFLSLLGAIAMAEPKEAPKAAPAPTATPTAPATPSTPPAEIPDERFQLELGFGVPQYILTFDGGGNRLNYEPNLNSLTELSVGYEGIMVGWGFRNAVSGEDAINKGSSTFTDYWFGYSIGAIRIDAFYGQFKGFYIESGDNNTAAQKTLAPDLSAQTFGADVSWVLDPEEFSLRSAVDMSRRPKASGGSWLVGAAYLDTSFNDSMDIFPAAFQGSMGEDGTLRSAHFQALSVKGGYGYTWKFGEKWMMSLAAQVGPGAQRSNVNRVSDSYSDTRFSMKYDGWLTGGWHGDDWFSGIKILFDGGQFQTRSLSVQSQLMEAKLFVGHAF